MTATIPNGVFLKDIGPGALIVLETETAKYCVAVLGKDSTFLVKIDENRLPIPIVCRFEGNLAATIFKKGFVAIGMHLVALSQGKTLEYGEIKKMYISTPALPPRP